MKQSQMKELLLQSLEHERGGIHVYETAMKCVVNKGLAKEFGKYLDQTREHERILMQVQRLVGPRVDADGAGSRVYRRRVGQVDRRPTPVLPAGAKQICINNLVGLREYKLRTQNDAAHYPAEHLIARVCHLASLERQRKGEA